jgi:hypothetical protein
MSRHIRYGGAIEGSGQEVDEPQEARARELEEVGLHRWAERVRKCGLRFGHQIRSCKVRCCPRCAARKSEENFAKAYAEIISMTSPIVGIFNVLSVGLWDLDKAFRRMSASLRSLRRHRMMLGIRRSVGFIEAKLTADKKRWNVHVHVVLEAWPDAAGDLDHHWKMATGGMGHFELDERIHVNDAVSLARYITKARDWSPSPGTLHPKILDLLLRGQHQRRLFVRWGARARTANITWVVRLGRQRESEPLPPARGGRHWSARYEVNKFSSARSCPSPRRTVPELSRSISCK